MDAASFRSSLAALTPPTELDPLLTALWLAWNGRWEEAHDAVNRCEGTEGAWLHAHLHREEGDLHNADYWYRRAQREGPTHGLIEEREAMLQAWTEN
ncbi:MAG: hypothetical protein CMJ94_04795 [Planctomycetes bacterium]|nr:hypothetical protein [Planctomycetota bacterium]